MENVLDGEKAPANSTASNQYSHPPIDEEAVGFEDDANSIIQQLNGGTKELDIVSIVGMPGLEKRQLSLWLEFAKDLSSHVLEEQSMKIIESSYDHLEDYLKSCLLYMGLFPEDYKFPVSNLLKLWIAENCVQNIDTENSMEEASRSCLNDLVNRSLVVVTKRRGNGEIKHFTVHDVVREFCSRKLTNEKFMQLIVPYNPNQPLDAQESRLCMCIHDDLVKQMVQYDYSWDKIPLVGLKEGESFAKCHRSLEFITHPEFYAWDQISLFPLLDNVRFIRVLNLLDIYLKSSWATTMQAASHLRYLAICTKEFDFQWVSHLLDLQTLRVEWRDSTKILLKTSAIWKMQKLRHVDIDEFSFTWEDNDRAVFEELETVLPNLKDFWEVLHILKKVAVKSKKVEELTGCDRLQVHNDKQIMASDFIIMMHKRVISLIESRKGFTVDGRQRLCHPLPSVKIGHMWVQIMFKSSGGRRPKKKTYYRVNDLDRVMELQKKPSLILRLKSIIQSQKNQYLLLRDLEKEVGFVQKWNFMGIIEKYPSIFRVTGGNRTPPMVMLTEKADKIALEEDEARVQMEPILVKNLRKLLMLSVDCMLPLETIQLIENELGLPSDFEQSLIPKYPQFFSVKDVNGRSSLQLENWDSLLAVTAREESSKKSGSSASRAPQFDYGKENTEIIGVEETLMDCNRSPQGETAQILLEFLEVAVTSLKGVYPSGAFERRRYMNVVVQRARHPELQQYIHSAVVRLLPFMQKSSTSKDAEMWIPTDTRQWQWQWQWQQAPLITPIKSMSDEPLGVQLYL
ncbi:hypothetical protein K7X08_010612 [Anisodus acutangulus]|uniref:Uncharacterized protein n=1 Tax=Anisodus acutangulus TaxID=402998 RepID=A0A9Q1RAC8_9SOLA|nr:hypothetical protein K7X08_010612 [Anisodus acutangulus]